MLESRLRRAVLAALKAHYPAPCGQWRGYPRFTHGAGGGEPDIYGCWKGQMVQIELKSPNRHSSPRQRVVQEMWESAGALVITDATSTAEVINTLHTTLGE